MVTMRTTNAASQSVQDFLKAVYTLQQKMERVSTNALAGMLSISAPLDQSNQFDFLTA